MADCESCLNFNEVSMCADCENGSNFERIVLTNADRIRAMNDEELRDLFSGIDHFWDNTPTVVIEGKRMEDNPTDILEWLQSEVE